MQLVWVSANISIGANIRFMTAAMNISMPESLKEFVDERVRDRGYGLHSESLRDSVRGDELDAAKNKFRALVAQGLSSPPGRPWGELKAELVSRALAQSQIAGERSKRR